MFNKKAFVWLLFKKEMIFLVIGLVLGLLIMYLIAADIVPVGLNICK